MTITATDTISLSGLGKRYGSTRAVEDVTLSVGRGVIGLLGPNGAGKTTLLRMIATVLAPDSGDLRLLGLDPARPTERIEIRRRWGRAGRSRRDLPRA